MLQQCCKLLSINYIVIDKFKYKTYTYLSNYESRSVEVGVVTLEFQETPRGQTISTTSMLQANKLLDSGCQGYLANIADSMKKRESVPDDIIVVREYLSMFPNDLGLPPDYRIEFSIEIDPRNCTDLPSPISC